MARLVHRGNPTTLTRASLCLAQNVEYDAPCASCQSHVLVQRGRDCGLVKRAATMIRTPLAEQPPVPSPVLHAPQEGRDDFNMRRMAKLIDRFDPRHFIATGT
jgi:hypothetical protein